MNFKKQEPINLQTVKSILPDVSLVTHSYGLLGHRMFDEHTQGTTTSGTYHGRFTRDIHDPELLIPRRVTEDGSFLTFTLPNFYDRQELDARKKRAARTDANANTDANHDTVDNDLADHTLHLVLPFNGANHHVELTPHHEFISPDIVVETRGEGALTDLNNGIRFKRVPDLQCHYRGRIRGHDKSRAALSLCEGVAGYVQTDQGRFFIEPLEEAVPDEEGQHIHMVYKRSAPNENSDDKHRDVRTCGTSDDWEKAWANEIEIKNRKDRLAHNGTLWKRAPSSITHSIHRYVELAVFCDKRFLEYHKGKDYEQYILTIMNMVSDFYHDASVGNQMDVVVVRIVYLEKEKEEIDLLISPEAEKTLESFAAWQNKMNPKDSKHPNHHDVAVLVTRYDICLTDGSDMPCSLMGLAYVAAACNPERSACINEDSGLMLGIVITHEVGHTLGSGHDEPDKSGCEAQDNTDKSYFVMSPYGSIFTLRWSPCSRKFITTYLESNLGECLSDNFKKPNEKYKFPGMLPGAMYDGNYQCDQTFPGTTMCELGQEVCEKLWCQTKNDKQCKSRSSPAEGTKCADNKWCIHHQCVDIGKRPAAVHGGWGSWSGMGECSRTCGGGVRFSERECNNPAPKNGGRYCIGERKKYSSCNTNPCDENKPSYRAQQCSEFDSKNVLTDGLHKWKPVFVANENPCILYCVNEKSTYVKLAPTVKDGTPCEAGTQNFCIGGNCRKVGCDWVIDSDAVDDECGICKGDGTQCSPVEGDYKEINKNDYQKIVTVPKGSRNIRLRELAAAENTLAIKLEKDNKFVLNGDHTEERDGEYPCAGSIAIYSHPEPKKEEVLIKGPIKEEIQLLYTFYNRVTNPGIHYVYYVPSVRAGSKPQYVWDFLDWSPCSVKCGGGTQLSQASCVEQQSGKVSNSYCKDIARPEPKSRICGTKACTAKWRVSQWSRCSACGGKNGVQKRKVQCVKPAVRSGGEDVQAALSACKGKAPKQSQTCVGSKPCKKKCVKKPRSNFFDEQNEAYNDKQSSPEEQRHVIDKLVDVGMTRYLGKPNTENIAIRSQKRNVGGEFRQSIDDWEAPSNDIGSDGKRDCSETDAKLSAATIKPGSIIKDPIPSSSIVLEEAPFVNGVSQTNLSDQAFQEDGDIIGVELETNKLKTYRGAEAAKRLQSTNHTDNEPIPTTTVGG